MQTERGQNGADIEVVRAESDRHLHIRSRRNQQAQDVDQGVPPYDIAVHL